MTEPRPGAIGSLGLEKNGPHLDASRITTQRQREMRASAVPLAPGGFAQKDLDLRGGRRYKGPGPITFHPGEAGQTPP